MRYVSIDLETTGLSPHEDQVLMAALVIEDTLHPEVPVEDLPTFACLVKHPRYYGDAYALALNAEILRAVASSDGETASLRGRVLPVYDPDTYGGWQDAAWSWLKTQLPNQRKYTAAGKNAAGFDLQFLSERFRNAFRHRVLDPGSRLADLKSDEYLPSLDSLKIQVLDGSPVAHDAIDDARDVIRVLRTTY